MSGAKEARDSSYLCSLQEEQQTEAIVHIDTMDHAVEILARMLLLQLQSPQGEVSHIAHTRSI